MDPSALIPYGLALRAYHRGQSEAHLIIRRDDGFEVPLPVSHFFRPPTEFSPIELAAIERCRGNVLDIGAGSGLHSLTLQAEGMVVTAIDICPEAAEVMTQRGVQDVRCGNILEFLGGPFDTLLMLGHGIGIVEDLAGLDRFLARAQKLIESNGQLLLHSLDVRQTDDPKHLAYHEYVRNAGRYIGETRLRIEYEGESGPYCGWLHVDPQTLRERAEPAGWECETILMQEGGDYLARLTR
jgi:SAM-dependent methyltransferase